jgi:hypothetical protein
MPTEKQMQQQKLFRLKGSLCMAETIVMNARDYGNFSDKFKSQLGEVYRALLIINSDFNKEVGWRTKI